MATSTSLAVTSAAVCLGAALLLWPGGGRCGLKVVDRQVRARDVPEGAGAPGAALSPADLVAVVEMVATQVRAGAAPLRAWQIAVEVRLGDGERHSGSAGVAPRSGLAPVEWLDAVAAQADRRATGRSLASAARSAACGWRLADRTGAPLAEVLESVAHTLRQAALARAEVEAALAGPRATARLLTGLPLAGVGLGQLIGAHPLAVLTMTSAGRMCLVAGAVMLAGGHWWMRRLVAAVEATA